MMSFNTKIKWLNEFLNEHQIRCVNIFRMDATMFWSLCFDLETQYELKLSRRMSVIEKVNMFV
jgi:hypothetical protein